MLGFNNRVSASFSGSIFNDDAHLADIELDGTGMTAGQRKLWRCRLLNGQDVHIGEYEMRMENRSRKIRFDGQQANSGYGYVELL